VAHISQLVVRIKTYSYLNFLTCSLAADKTCNIVEVKSGESVMELSGIHKEGLNDVVWLHGDIPAVATASDDQVILIWDTERACIFQLCLLK
jgi:WD40 repeat protein